FTIAANAVTGPRTVTVTNDNATRTASLADAFTVQANSGLGISSVSPPSLAQGATQNVLVTGVNTTFTPGVTTGNFGDGVVINSVTVGDALHATFNVTVSPLASVGLRTVTVVTGGEFAVASNGFSVTRSAAALVSISKTSGVQGDSQTVTIS